MAIQLTGNQAKLILEAALSVARAANSQWLEPAHLVLGALRFKVGQELIAEAAGVTEPLNPRNLDAECRRLVYAVGTGGEQCMLPLHPVLKSVVSEVSTLMPSIDLSVMVARSVELLLKDETWKRRILNLRAVQMSPCSMKFATQAAKLRDMTTRLTRHLQAAVVGQDSAIARVVEHYAAASLNTGARQAKGGVGSVTRLVTLAGPSGVGKSLLAESLASFHAPATGHDVLRINMRAFSSEHSRPRLLRGDEEVGLAQFLTEHPCGFVLVEDTEFGHDACLDVLSEIISSGEIRNPKDETTRDCSGATFIFMTNLGAQLYDSPNRAGVLQDSAAQASTLLKALEGPRNSKYGDEPEGLPRSLLGHLSAGAVVLMERLSAVALEQIAQRTFSAVAKEFHAVAGMPLELMDMRIPTLWMLRFGVQGDARELTNELRAHLYEMLGRVMIEGPSAKVDWGSWERSVSGLSVGICPGDPMPQPFLDDEQRRTQILLVDDDEWGEQMSGPFECSQVQSKAEAERALKSLQPDFVLLDLHIGTEREQPGFEKGLELLSWFRNVHPWLPVYLFSEFPDRRGLSMTLLERVRREGGARGVLTKSFYGKALRPLGPSDPFRVQLAEIDRLQRQERLLRHYQRQSKQVYFDWELSSSAKEGGLLRIELHRFREMTAVAAESGGDDAWQEVPRDRFSDVAGVEDAKLRLGEIVQWLKDPKSLAAMGVDVPTGLLLAGPPGTGKTSLARALAGEANAPFFAVSGSQVFSKWIGESESNVRKLFARARKYAPSVVFIDEIDSIGRSRVENGDADKWKDGILNELLAQMDGFRRSEFPVFVVAATNMPESLDPALVRPGRFDATVEVPLPHMRARCAILELQLAKLKTKPEVDVEELARRSTGMSGADLRHVVQEAAILALRRQRGSVDQELLHEALTCHRMGPEARNLVLSQETRRTTAVHEAGHALLQHRLFPDEPLAQVSVLPRGKALGFAEHGESDTYKDLTKSVVERRLEVLLAGRAAEELLLPKGSATAGCADDLARATSLASQAVVQWGMDSDFGLVSLPGLLVSLSQRGAISSRLSELMEASVASWLQEAKARATQRLSSEVAILESLAAALEQEETLYASRLRELLENTAPRI